MYDAMGDKGNLFRTLLKMYSATLNTLLEEPPAGEAVSWKAID